MLPNPRQTIAAILLLMFLSIFAVFPAYAVEPIPVLQEQLTILDGDTIVVTTKDNRYKIRLANIDAPEKYQPYGPEATQYLAELLNTPIFYVYIPDPEVTTYNRQIGIVYTESMVDASVLMLQAGMAWWYEKYSDHPDYGVVEREARKHKLGLWAQDTPLAPWLYRKGVSYEILSRYYVYRPVAPGLSKNEKRGTYE